MWDINSNHDPPENQIDEKNLLIKAPTFNCQQNNNNFVVALKTHNHKTMAAKVTESFLGHTVTTNDF